MERDGGGGSITEWIWVLSRWGHISLRIHGHICNSVGRSPGSFDAPDPACSCTCRTESLRWGIFSRERACFAVTKGDKDPFPVSVDFRQFYHCHLLCCVL